MKIANSLATGSRIVDQTRAENAALALNAVFFLIEARDV
jgi:hypothetical protein